MADLGQLNGQCPFCRKVGRLGMVHRCLGSDLEEREVKLIRMMGMVVACILNSGETDG